MARRIRHFRPRGRPKTTCALGFVGTRVRAVAHDELIARAAAANKTVSGLLRDVIEQYISRSPKIPPT